MGCDLAGVSCEPRCRRGDVAQRTARQGHRPPASVPSHQLRTQSWMTE